nr:HAMP domain-containing sensor histidine kinase [Galbitalea soli]
MRGRTIRARITVWSVLAGAVIMIVAGLGFQLGLDAVVTSSTRSLLSSNVAPYEAAVQAGATTAFDPPGEGQIVAVVDPAGVVRVSSLSTALTVELPRLTAMPAGVHRVTTASTVYDVVSEAVRGRGGTWHVVAARNRATEAVVRGGIGVVEVIVGLVLVAAFGLASWVGTGLALRPVGRMRERARKLSSAGGADTLPVGPVRDELSELAETLNAFITSVRASNDRERQMVADASHELRTPIAVLKTQLQLAHLSSGDAVALEREISEAESTLDRLSSLATSLLALSSIESAGPVAVTSGEEIIAEFLAAMDRAVLLASGYSVTVDFAGVTLDPAVRLPISTADFSRLVDNLVANAIAASPRGSTVVVSLGREGQTGVLRVRDSGHGMPASFIPVAFNRFTRSEASRGRADGLGGSGLGLAIVKAIVVRGGGDVRLLPRPDGGVEAIVTLPVVD